MKADYIESSKEYYLRRSNFKRGFARGFLMGYVCCILTFIIFVWLM